MQWPIHGEIVNGRRVTIEVICVNGRKVPAKTLNAAIADFRTCLAGDLHVMDPIEVQVDEGADESIDAQQCEHVLAHRRATGVSAITIVLGPRVRDGRPMNYHMRHGKDGGHIAWIRWTRPGLGLRCALRRLRRLPREVVLGWRRYDAYIIRHELFHTLGVPCDATHASDDHHCTDLGCVLSGRQPARVRIASRLRTGRAWPVHLCAACRGEIERARQAADGVLVAPDAPYNPMDALDQMVILNTHSAMERLHRAQEYVKQGNIDAAIRDYDSALELGAGNHELMCLRNRGTLWWRLEQYDKACKDWEACVQRDGSDVNSLYNLAWLLSCCPAEGVRDGQRAVELARRACELTNWNNAGMLALLASAHAEVGHFGDAVENQKKAIAATEACRAEEMNQDLELYTSGKPKRAMPT